MSIFGRCVLLANGCNVSSNRKKMSNNKNKKENWSIEITEHFVKFIGTCPGGGRGCVCDAFINISSSGGDLECQSAMISIAPCCAG